MTRSISARQPRASFCLVVAATCLCLALSGCDNSRSERSPAASAARVAPRTLTWKVRSPARTPRQAPIERNTRGVHAKSLPDQPPPATTQEEIAEPTGTGSATLSWTPPIETLDGLPFQGISKYRIDYGRDRAVLERTVEIDNPGLTSYVIENLAPGTWYFRITAFDASGNQSLATQVGEKVVD